MSLKTFLETVEQDLVGLESNLPTLLTEARTALAVLQKIEPLVALVNPAAGAITEEVVTAGEVVLNPNV